MVAYLACDSRGLFRLLLHLPREEPFLRQLKQEPKKSLLLKKAFCARRVLFFWALIKLSKKVKDISSYLNAV